MPSATRKRKLSPADEDETTRPTRRVTKAKASSKARGNRSGEDQSANGNHYDSDGEYSRVTPLSKKGRTSISDAKAGIRDKAAELVKFIKSQRQVNLPQHTAGTDGFKLDEAALRVNTKSFYATANRRAERGAFYQPSQAIKHFNSMTRDYEAASKEHAKLDKPTWMRWEQDKKDLRAFNQEAMSIAARSIHESITSTASTTATSPPDTATDIERVAWDLLEETRPKPNQTWGSAAQEILQVAAGVFRLFSEGEAM